MVKIKIVKNVKIASLKFVYAISQDQLSFDKIWLHIHNAYKKVAYQSLILLKNSQGKRFWKLAISGVPVPVYWIFRVKFYNFGEWYSNATSISRTRILYTYRIKKDCINFRVKILFRITKHIAKLSTFRTFRKTLVEAREE